MSATMEAARAAGYIKSPNNIWGIGDELYAFGPGLPELPHGQEVYINDNHTGDKPQDEWPIGVYTYLYGGGKPVLIRRHETFEKFLASCTAISKPGLPAFSNSWD